MIEVADNNNGGGRWLFTLAVLITSVCVFCCFDGEACYLLFGLMIVSEEIYTTVMVLGGCA